MRQDGPMPGLSSIFADVKVLSEQSRCVFSAANAASGWRLPGRIYLRVFRARQSRFRSGTILRCNGRRLYLNGSGRIRKESGVRLSLRILPGPKEDSVNPFRLAGKSNRQQRTRDARTKSDSSRRDEVEAPAPSALTPLTGRDTEFSLLQDRWEQAQEGMGQVVLVVGQPGLGKSRLVQTLTQRVQAQAGGDPLAAVDESVSTSIDRDSPIIEWRCSQHFQNSELHPVSDYLERLIGAGRDPSPTARFDRLARHLEEYDLGRPDIVALFAKLLFLPPDERYSAAGLTPAREREETFLALRQWLRAYSGQRSILFVVEDLHWIDASTLEFLGHFISEGPHDRILTVLTSRPEFKPPWPVLAHQTTLALNRLTRRQVAEWMRRDAGAALPESLVAQIFQRTNGIPLLVEEFTRMARESTVFESAGAAPPRRAAASTKELPRTLQELVMARLDRISSNREVVHFAATLGREFDYELLAAVVNVDERTLRAELANLVSAGILYVKGQPPACTYFFKHALLEEALHSTIDEPKRRRFHQQVAEVMEVQFTQLVETQPELLAEHFTEAGITEKAIGYCLKAGLRSRDRFAHVEAVSHLTKGLQLLETLEPSPERDARELELLGPLGTSYIASRGYAAPEVGPVFERARSLCERVGQTPQLFATIWGNFAFHIVRGDFVVCAELAEEAMAFGERLNDPGILMEALFLKGLTRLYRGDFAGARDCCARAIAEFDDRERTAFWAALVGEDAGVTHRCYLALALWHLGFPVQALQLNDEMLKLARVINQPFSLEYALHHTGWFYQHCRLGVQAEAAGNEQIRIATEQGFRFWHASGTLYAAGGLLLQGQPEQGLRLLQKGLEDYRGTGAELGLPYYLSILADGCTQTGRFAEARLALNEALALVEKNDERFQEAELLRLKGELSLAESGDQTAAEECFRRAVETALRQRSKAWELRATMSLARLWQKQGRREEALRALTKVHGVYNEGFTMPDLADAAALLENLADERMRAEFAAGIKYVRDCIPPPMHGLVSVDWRYLPASTLGGDTIGYHWVDEDHLALYLIDVTGHGLDAALLSVTVANVIRAGALPGADMKQPDQVLAKLNDVFQGELHGEKFFTIWYGVYHSTSRTMFWAGGGHPPSVLLLPGEPIPLRLPSAGLIMGVLPGVHFPAQSCRIPSGARLLIFSDGVFEIFHEGRAVWDLDACVAHLASMAELQGSLMDELVNHVHHLRGSPRLDDDFSIIEARFH
jgi:serine phosphatase RsbU (regulator of sigma subunit)/energy-coupling factor transporter ATP-binding protein EcfA2